jgi:hypothetical protein
LLRIYHPSAMATWSWRRGEQLRWRLLASGLQVLLVIQAADLVVGGGVQPAHAVPEG